MGLLTWTSSDRNGAIHPVAATSSLGQKLAPLKTNELRENDTAKRSLADRKTAFARGFVCLCRIQCISREIQQITRHHTAPCARQSLFPFLVYRLLPVERSAALACWDHWRRHLLLWTGCSNKLRCKTRRYALHLEALSRLVWSYRT